MNNDDTVKLCVDNTRVEMSFQNEVEWLLVEVKRKIMSSRYAIRHFDFEASKVAEVT